MRPAPRCTRARRRARDRRTTARNSSTNASEQGVLVEHSARRRRAAPATAPCWRRSASRGSSSTASCLSGSFDSDEPRWMQEDREHDVRRHLQELALPVLEGRLAEVRPGQVAAQRNRGLTVVELVGIERAMAGQDQGADEDGEDGEARETQRVRRQKESRGRIAGAFADSARSRSASASNSLRPRSGHSAPMQGSCPTAAALNRWSRVRRFGCNPGPVAYRPSTLGTTKWRTQSVRGGIVKIVVKP